MDAVILAAGFGSRLQSCSACKPLTLVGGIALIEIVIRQAAAAGATRIIVVTGHLAETVEAYLPAIAERISVEVVARRVDDWSLPNGYSVLAGAAGLPGNYLLMMSDHIFSNTILPKLANCENRLAGAILAIDRRTTDPLIDPDDATWVRTGEDNTIREIGKTLSVYDAVDCGAFLASSELTAAIAQAIAEGRPGSLSDGMQRLADAGRAHVVDIGEAWWIDVDDARALALAEEQVKQALPNVFAAPDDAEIAEAP